MKNKEHPVPSPKKPNAKCLCLHVNAGEFQHIWNGLDRLYQRYENTPFWAMQVEIRLLIEKLVSEFVEQVSTSNHENDETSEEE